MITVQTNSLILRYPSFDFKCELDKITTKCVIGQMASRLSFNASLILVFLD